MQKSSTTSIIIGVLVILILILLFGASCNSQKFEVIDSTLIVKDYNQYITGTVRNHTTKEFQSVTVEINLYDKTGAQVGSTNDTIFDLEPNGSWKFSAIILENSATYYQIKKITGYRRNWFTWNGIEEVITRF